MTQYLGVLLGSGLYIRFSQVALRSGERVKLGENTKRQVLSSNANRKNGPTAKTLPLWELPVSDSINWTSDHDFVEERVWKGSGREKEGGEAAIGGLKKWKILNVC
jgi:hypothetical protein